MFFQARLDRRVLILVGPPSLLFGLYLFASFGLAGELDLTAKMNGFFDMDIHRVVEDWTTQGGGTRTGVHPLYKLAVAPAGTLLRQGASEARVGLDVSRGIVAFVMAMNALLVGLLAGQLAGGSRSAVAAATLLCGLSFSSMLLGAVPESASLACLSAVIPLLYLNTRLGKPMPRTEVLIWILLGALGIGLTVTQIMFWGIALVVRLVAMWRDSDRRRPGLETARFGVIVIGLSVLAIVLAEIQSRLYPVTHPPFYLWRVEAEMHWLQLDALRGDPVGHLLNVIRHFVVYDFVAPQIGMSDFLFRMYGTRSPAAWWSVSIDGAPLGRSGALEIVSLIGLLCLFVLLIIRFRKRLPLVFLAPALCIGGQLVLHALYGREYIIFSANWHGVLVALMIGVLWRGHRIGRLLPVLGGLWLMVLAANNLSAMGQAYGEFEGGLGRDQRDERGVLLPPVADTGDLKR